MLCFNHDSTIHTMSGIMKCTQVINFREQARNFTRWRLEVIQAGNTLLSMDSNVSCSKLEGAFVLYVIPWRILDHTSQNIGNSCVFQWFLVVEFSMMFLPYMKPLTVENYYTQWQLFQVVLGSIIRGEVILSSCAHPYLIQMSCTFGSNLPPPPLPSLSFFLSFTAPPHINPLRSSLSHPLPPTLCTVLCICQHVHLHLPRSVDGPPCCAEVGCHVKQWLKCPKCQAGCSQSIPKDIH